MAEKLQLMLEAERRGILPPEGQLLLDEARKRGLIMGGASSQGSGISEPTIGPAPITPGTRAGMIAPGGQSATVDLRGPTLEQQQAFQEQQQNLGIGDPGMGVAALRGGGRQLLDNLLAVPEAAVNIPAQALASGVNAVAGTNLQPEPFNMPSAAEVTAGTQAALGTPGALMRGEGLNFGQRYQDALERQQAVDIRFKEEAPIATNVGEVGGDIATIAATRGMGRAALTGSALPAAAPSAAPLAQAAQTVLGKIVQSTGRVLSKAGGRALETGAEGAFLASLQNADPMTVGGMAAGGQILGDISRPAFKKLANPVNLMAAVGAASLVSLGIQQWTPGGLDRILPTMESKNKEAFLALLITGSAAAITGRPGTNLTGSPALDELANLVPRGILQANLVSAVKDPTRTAPILAKFAEDPDYFGPKGKRLLTRALTVEGASLSATVDSLMDDRGFRQKFSELR